MDESIGRLEPDGPSQQRTCTRCYASKPLSFLHFRLFKGGKKDGTHAHQCLVCNSKIQGRGQEKNKPLPKNQETKSPRRATLEKLPQKKRALLHSKSLPLSISPLRLIRKYRLIAPKPALPPPLPIPDTTETLFDAKQADRTKYAVRGAGKGSGIEDEGAGVRALV